jgi:hypothetical protein
VINNSKSGYLAPVLCTFLCIILSCSPKKVDGKLSMTDDEIVHAMVQMYTANAAWNLNDISYQDSTKDKYYEDVAKIVGRPISDIKTDFETLLQMPDSLLVLQGRALDTLRKMQENSFKIQSTVKPAIN